MPRKRAAGYENQREAIIEQAAALFARNGFVGTSMNEVALACGLSKASLYHYFADKHQLLMHICENHIDRLCGLVDEVAQQDLAPEPRLRLLVQRFVEEYSDAQNQHRVLTEDVRFLEPGDHRAERARRGGGGRRHERGTPGARSQSHGQAAGHAAVRDDQLDVHVAQARWRADP